MHFLISYFAVRQIIISQPSLNSIVQVDSVTGSSATLASDLAEPTGIALGCMPRPSYLLPEWEESANSLAVAMLFSMQSILQALISPTYSSSFLSPIVTGLEDAEISCPAMLLNYDEFVIQSTDWAASTIEQMANNALSETSGGQGLFDGMTGNSGDYAQTVDLLMDASVNVSAGFGAGYGFSIQCNGTILFVFGVGFGGGLSAIR